MDIGSTYSESFSFSQTDVQKFAEVSGDFNPIHLDEQYAAGTPFKQPIIHGFLGSSIFSKILGTRFPGEGTIYLKQTMDFKRPMFVDVQYVANLTVKEIDKIKNTAVIETRIIDQESGKVITLGDAVVMNKNKIL